MRPTTEAGDGQRQGEPGPLGRRLAWFAALWLAGLLATAAVAYGLRALLFL
jgi:hypothetical protein